MRLFLLLHITCMFLALQSIASAQIGAPTPKAPKKVFFIDPVKGSKNGDGTNTRPWRTLQEVWEAKLINGEDLTSGAVHAGDLIYLKTGNHGSIVFSPYAGSLKVNNTDYITIQAAPGSRPVINSVRFIRSANWVLRGVTLENPASFTVRPNLVSAENSSNIIIDNNTIQSEANAVEWTPEDWPNLSAEYAILFNVVNGGVISNNNIRNVHNGISIRGNNLLVTGNRIDYFANDGIQFSSSNTIISRNRITNHYGQWADGFHHDLMQGWTAYDEPFTTNVLIDSNIAIASTGIYPTIPAAPSGDGDEYVQGISVFDGDWDNLTITNNVVAAAAYHGMGLYGISDSVIANNTVIAQSPQYSSWIGIFSQGNLVPTNVIVRNNIAQAFALPQTGVTFDHNLTFLKGWQAWQRDAIPVVDPTKVFVKYDPAHAIFDFRLLQSSAAVGTGSSLNAPTYDIMSIKRNPLKMDIGAYAYTP